MVLLRHPHQVGDDVDRQRRGEIRDDIVAARIGNARHRGGDQRNQDNRQEGEIAVVDEHADEFVEDKTDHRAAPSAGDG